MKKYLMGVKTVLVLILLVSSTVGTNAIQVEGDNDLQLSGGFFYTQGSDTGTLTLDASYGYFVTQSLQVGIGQGFSHSFVSDKDDPWTASTIPFVNYHFMPFENKNIQPFLGGFLGAIYNSDDFTGTVGPNAGFKFFVSDNTYVVTRYRYEWFFTDFNIGDVDDDAGDGNHVVTIGLGFVWGGKQR